MYKMYLILSKDFTINTEHTGICKTAQLYNLVIDIIFWIMDYHENFWKTEDVLLQ